MEYNQDQIANGRRLRELFAKNMFEVTGAEMSDFDNLTDTMKRVWVETAVDLGITIPESKKR